MRQFSSTTGRVAPHFVICDNNPQDGKRLGYTGFAYSSAVKSRQFRGKGINMKKGRLFHTIRSMILVCLISVGTAHAMTIDGSVDENEVPMMSFDKAYKLSTVCLSTNAFRYVCVMAGSIRSKYRGGWRFFFESKTLKTRYIHVDGNGQVVRNNLSSSRRLAKSLPSLSMHEAIESAIKFRQGVFLGAAWETSSDDWQVHIIDRDGEKFTLIVDAKKNVKTLDLTNARRFGE